MPCRRTRRCLSQVGTDHPVPQRRLWARRREAKLAGRGVAIEPDQIVALCGEDAALSSLVLADGREVPVDAFYLAAGLRRS